jgi:hypothetical protein
MAFDETRQSGRSSRGVSFGSTFTILIASVIALAALPANAEAPTLLKRVESVLRSDSNLNGASAYTTTPGVVILYGVVFDKNDRELAEQRVRKIKGVKDVINTLRTSTGEWLEQEARINDTLQLNDLPNIQAKVIGQEVYLSGTTTSDADKQRAVRVAASVAPNLQVVDFMRVVPGPMFSTPSFF